MTEVTTEQIAAWKKQYGEIFQLNVDGKSCFLKKPDRKTLSYASMAAKTNPLKFTEVILKDCWLAGDMEIQTNDTLFMSAGAVLDKLIEVKEAELVKL